MSNQDQYGQKTQGSQYGDDFESLSDEQKIQRKEQQAQQQGGQPSMGGKDDLQSQGQSNLDYGADFDSLSDDEKIQRKQQYAQNQGSQTQSQGGMGATGQSDSQSQGSSQDTLGQQSTNKTGYGSSNE